MKRPRARLSVLHSSVEWLEARSLMTLAGNQLFPTDNPWNQNISAAPVASNSSAIINNIITLAGSDGHLHPDFSQDFFGSNPLDGLPYNIVHGNSTPKVNVVIDDDPNESDIQPAPIPANPVIEGDQQDGPTVGPANRGDSHLIVYDEDNNIAYEFFYASRPSENSDGQWHAAQESVWNLNQDSFRPQDWTSADAAGLPILPGLVRPDEGLPVSQGGQGVINHAIQFTLANNVILDQFLYPASHVADPGNNNAAIEPPMGTRFRLKANVDISKLSPESQIIAQAMKTYGMIIADNGANFFLSGASESVQPDGSILTWDNNDIQSSVTGLKSLTFSDFEVVDPTPIVTGLSTSAASSGATLTIIGQNFSGVAGRLQVFFGNTPAANVTVIDDSHVTATVPAGTGTVDVRVQSGLTTGTDPSNIKSPIFGYGTSAISAADRFTFSAADPALTVASLTPTTTGFNATFNVPFNIAPLNLYDTAGAGFGPADVTLVGANSGPVPGSLIVSPGNQEITFVKTGGVLAPDTYTVTFRSASNGFEDISGGLLDGNGDGTPGDNYTTTFTVAPSSARVVSIPDFARGPGQPVNVPATGAGLPLSISDGTNVTIISLTLTYNPSLLSITGANVGASAPGGSMVNLNTSTPGVAVLTFTSPTALPAGLDTFATLVASVPNTAPYASKEDLVIGNLSLNGQAIASIDDDGVHVVAYLGDTTGNGGYSGLDASLIARVVANIDTGFAAFPLLDPTILGDIAGRGSLTAQDAAFVAQFVANVPQLRIPALPGITITKGGPDPLVWLPQILDAAPGSTLTVPVLFRQTNGSTIALDSADIAIEFDPSIFMVNSVSLGNVPQGFTLTASYDNATGEIIASARSTSGPIQLSPGVEGSLLLIDLAVRPGSSPGRARLNLLGEGRVENTVLYTALNDGNLTLTPAPTDSDLDSTDGVVTISSPESVPITVPTRSGPGSLLPPAGPADVIDLALESTQGQSPSVTVTQPGGSSSAIMIPWAESDPSVLFPLPDDPSGIPNQKKDREDRASLTPATPPRLELR